MYFPKDAELTKFDFSVYAGASLIELLKRQRDAVGLTFFADKIEIHTSAKSSMAHHRYLYSELEKRMLTYTEDLKKDTNAIKALDDVAELCHTRSLIIIFSDLLDDPDKTDELFRAIQHMKHNKHEVVLFHVVDQKTEVDFDLENRPYELIDMETGEHMRLQPGEIKELYKSSVNAYFEELKIRCMNYGIDFMPVDIAAGYDQVLQQYMIKRQKLY
jgi:uncharacterized protein (DUF58 family)